MARSWAALPGILETDLGGELILLDPVTQEMFSLNPVGRMLWHGLPGTDEALVRRLVAAYDVSFAEAESDVRRLLSELLEAGLIAGSDDAADS